MPYFDPVLKSDWRACTSFVHDLQKTGFLRGSLTRRECATPVFVQKKSGILRLTILCAELRSALQASHSGQSREVLSQQLDTCGPSDLTVCPAPRSEASSWAGMLFACSVGFCVGVLVTLPVLGRVRSHVRRVEDAPMWWPAPPPGDEADVVSLTPPLRRRAAPTTR